MNLTDIVANNNQRVGALESSDLDENAPVARITKIYGNVKVTMAIKTYVHTFPVCGDNLYCADTLYI